MDLRQTAVLMLAVGALLVSVYSQAVCNSPGWFGSLCQYKCRCSDNNCTTEGACQHGAPCQKGWFGPACQYADLAYNRSSAWRATDGDDTTCQDPTEYGNVTVTLDHWYHVTWLRVRLNNPDLLYNLTVRFRQDGRLSCTNMRTARVDYTTLDIHCDLKKKVKHVYLSEKGVQHLCSVYISGGRNVALKQNSSQSSAYRDLYQSRKAVDGLSNQTFSAGTCSHTLPGDLHPNLNISLSKPQRVTRYVLYNRADGGLRYRLQGFQLRSFGPSMTPVFNYTDRSRAQLVYTVVPDPVTPPILLVNVAVNNNDMILTLCELEVYGDSACRSGQYGRECEHTCNCAGNQSCFVSTGGCPSGCATGFMGQDCKTGCDVGSYGPECQLACSQFCVRDSDPGAHFCDNTNGTCLHGCRSGYLGSNCSKRCEVGSYGPECQLACSQFCERDGDPGAHFCDHTNGTCLHGCRSGYLGSNCTERCDVGSYGPGCQLSCSQFCERDGDPGAHFCDHTNGTCLHGCQSGYQGSNCRCDVGSYGPECQLACSQFCVRDGDPGAHFCDHTNGTCLHGCQSGYLGSKCTERCDVGSYGPECQLACSQFCVRDGDPGAHFCDHTNGTCLHGCQSGYLGSKCTERCDVGSYGPECQLACSQFCVRDGDPGAHFCDHTNGTCLHGCQSGYLGSKCTERCDVGSYGPGCQLACSQFCEIDGDPGAHFCDHTNGTCLHGCQSGHQGSNCSERCDVGSYGPGCQLTCSQFCVRDDDPGAHFCDHTKGTCLHGCQSGYLGSTCSERCDVGSHGPGCQLVCSQFCVRDGDPKAHFCDHTNGTCLHGCQSGYLGSTCSEKLPMDVALVAVPVICGVGVGVLVLVVVAVVFCRRQTVLKDDPTLDANKGVNESHFNDVNSPTAEAVAASRHHTVQQAATTRETDGKQKEPHDDSNDVYQNIHYGKTSSVVSVDDLADFIKSTDSEFFENQFCTIPGNQAATMAVGLSPENKDKNRYKNICPYDHSRVRLLPNKAKNQGDYINASFVKSYREDEKFIASQGPTKTILEDFLRMLWEQEVDKVVMLTSLVEDGKQKCERYWPDEGHMKVGEMTVRLTTTQVFADYTIRRLQLKKESEPLRNLIQFHFTAWPDKDIPTAPWGLVDFEQRVAAYPTNKPIVVHCSAGVGRTGTFIALRNVMREAEDTGRMDFFTAVSKLRQDRINMVQTVDQYIFLHRAALVAILCSGRSLTLADVDQGMLTLATKSESGVTELEHEFQMICSVCEEQTAENMSEDNPSPVYENNQNIVNTQKNRVQSIISKPMSVWNFQRVNSGAITPLQTLSYAIRIPYLIWKDIEEEMYRAVLSCDNSDTSDYINAVLVPSLFAHDQEIVTQLPLPSTITDLWRLVTQYKVNLMVAFETDRRAIDQTIGDYLPSCGDGPKVVGYFILRTEPDTSTTLWKQENVYISQNADGNSTADKPWRVTHLACTTDLDPASLLSVTQHVRSVKSADQGRTLYMCRNGAEYSGLVYVLSLLLDRLDNDHHLTVPLVVGAVKAIRPQVIPTLDQYRLLYGALQLYSHSMNEYSNFTQ